jgi:phosphatidylinositol alpha 1,6-mannosyltransferase
VVVAPEPGPGRTASGAELPYPVVRVPSVPLPVYHGLRVGVPGRRVRDVLVGHGAEVVHLASPFVLGARAGAVARQLGLPTVAVYQTDLPAYAASYRLRGWGEAAAWRWLRGVHNGADRTLAPSTASAAALHEHGVRRVWLWRRGVDADRFDPAHRSAALRRELAPGGEVLVGYVGRLAAEKRVDLLAAVAALPGVRLVVVGGGPAEAALRAALPGAVFLGPRHGDELARLYASLDVFVHSGPYETFGQTLQEAAASALPVVAPAAGGPLDLVDDGRTGLLVPPLSGDALATAVRRLAAGADLRAAMGAAGRRRVLGRSWSALTDQLLDHYTAVLGTALTAAPERRAS